MRAHDCVQERGDLQRGQSVTLLTGRVVHSHEVMAPGVPGPCLVVVDCPTESHLDILASQAGPLTKWTVSSQRRALGKERPAAEAAQSGLGVEEGEPHLGGCDPAVGHTSASIGTWEASAECQRAVQVACQGVVASEANTVCSGAYLGEQKPCCSTTPAASTLSNCTPTI